MEIVSALQIPDGELTFTFARSGWARRPKRQQGREQGDSALECGSELNHSARRQSAAANPTGEPHHDRGELLIQGQRFRDQEKNKRDCLDRLRAMLLQALAVPKARKKTSPHAVRRNGGCRRNALKPSERQEGVVRVWTSETPCGAMPHTCYSKEIRRSTLPIILPITITSNSAINRGYHDWTCIGSLCYVWIPIWWGSSESVGNRL